MYIEKLAQDEVLSLTQILPVAEDSVTSLTLVQRKSLGMTLFSLDQGCEIPIHKTPGDALVQILTGVAVIQIGEKEHTVKQGESIVMPAGVPHGLKAAEAFQMLLTVVKEEG